LGPLLPRGGPTNKKPRFDSGVSIPWTGERRLFKDPGSPAPIYKRGPARLHTKDEDGLEGFGAGQHAQEHGRSLMAGQVQGHVLLALGERGLGHGLAGQVDGGHGAGDVPVGGGHGEAHGLAVHGGAQGLGQVGAGHVDDGGVRILPAMYGQVIDQQLALGEVGVGRVLLDGEVDALHLIQGEGALGLALAVDESEDRGGGTGEVDGVALPGGGGLHGATGPAVVGDVFGQKDDRQVGGGRGLGPEGDGGGAGDVQSGHAQDLFHVGAEGDFVRVGAGAAAGGLNGPQLEGHAAGKARDAVSVVAEAGGVEDGRGHGGVAAGDLGIAAGALVIHVEPEAFDVVLVGLEVEVRDHGGVAGGRLGDRGKHGNRCKQRVTDDIGIHGIYP
jgi:hypothetical protein